MHRTFIFLLVGTFILVVSGPLLFEQAYLPVPEKMVAQVISTPSPVSHWRLDEGLGSNVLDSTSNHHHGFLSPASSTPLWATGRIGLALQFDGVNNYVDIGNPRELQLGANDFSVSLWVYGNGNSKTFAIHGGTGDGGKRWQFGEFGTTSTHYFFAIDDDTTAKVIYGSKAPGNAWTHLIGVRSGNNLHLYEDGVEASGSPIDITGYGSITSSRGLLIGAAQSENSGLTSEFWSGLVDDVLVYRNALSASEVRTLFADSSSSPTPSPLPQASKPSPATPMKLKVSPNGHFLVTDDGAPFFWLFDTAWRLRKMSPGDIDLYLSTRAQQGFNGIQILGGYNALNATDHLGNKPFLGDNTDTPNEKFWQHIDYIITKARDNGLYVALFPLWGMEFNPAFGGDTAKADRLGNWFAHRYNNMTNVIWGVGAEYTAINGYTYPITPNQKAIIEAFALGINTGNTNELPMTIHPAVPWTSSIDFHNKTWLDFNMLQSGHVINREEYATSINGVTEINKEVYDLVKDDYSKTPAKPVLDGEPIYEDTADSILFCQALNRPRAGDDVMRRKAYWSVFAGAFGFTYGHRDVYNFYTPATPRQVWEIEKGGTGQRNDWTVSLSAPGATQMKHLRNLLESHDMLSRVPDQSLVEHTLSGIDKITATRGANYALIYSATGNSFNVNMGKIPGANVVARWYDPRTGAYNTSGLAIAYPNTLSTTQSFDPPGSPARGNDWVLVLDR